jgi:lauroyl/myristoyl acyltransferase
MLDFGIYLLYRAGSLAVRVLPLRFLFSLGEWLGLAAWALHGGYRRLAQRNLAVAFGNEKSSAELRRLARRHFQRLGANLLCSLKLPTMPLDEVRARVVIDNAELLTRSCAPAVRSSWR